MPLRNRVTPLGDLVSSPHRGLVYGNRGCLHDEHGEIRRRYATRRWIARQLEFRGRRRTRLMAPGKYTELFFLDDAAALAAGHRPCAECRRADYNRLVEVWSEIHPGQVGADAIDEQLHAERHDADSGERRLHDDRYRELPDGVFVLDEGESCVLFDSRLLRWSPAGYTAHRTPRAHQRTIVLTPPSLVALLERGWSPLVPLLHPTASA
jgi:hypothetical protein